MLEDESKTCAACGAFMNRYDTLCPICGAIAEEVLGEDMVMSISAVPWTRWNAPLAVLL